MLSITVPEIEAASKRAPIIDIHGHTFNTRYLPIKGILLGKRDMMPLMQLVPDNLAIKIAALAVSGTPVAQFPSGPQNPPETLALKPTLDRSGFDPGRTPGDPMTRAAMIQDQIAFESWKTTDPDLPVAGDPSLSSRIALFLYNKARGEDSPLEEFFRVAMTRDDKMANEFYGKFSDKPNLFVSMMMDLAPVYNQEEDGEILLSVEEQIYRNSYFQKYHDFIYFVAYNPFRDHWKSGECGDSSNIVFNAIDHHGAYGVKFYPPSGYRPANNRIPSPPLTVNKHPKEQWKARYGNLTNEELDRRIYEFLKECERRDIPVFSHSHTGEFEARKGYGRKMAHPRFWKDYLEQRSEESNEPCRLRLCFGHAGGHAYWFGEGRDSGWGSIVRELCETYPNVYCEVGVHSEIKELHKQALFARHLSSIFEKAENGTSGPYLLADKIMYGSDWFMLNGKEAEGYLEAYQKVFLIPQLQPYYDRFFYRNALSYLDVEDRINDDKLPHAVRHRLRNLGAP